MSEFHFVSDYNNLVTNLKANHDHTTAMDLAVGGNYEELGRIERSILKYCGLVDGMSVVDFGCGSGRLSTALSMDRTLGNIHYTGLDIVQDLLDYASSRSRPHFRFLLNHSFTFPIASHSTDIVNAFSVFTHLHQAEIHIYMGEISRVLKPGAKAILSFQSLIDHWNIFEHTFTAHRAHGKPWPHLNMFVERTQIESFASRNGMRMTEYISHDDAPWGGEGPLGQNIAVLVKL